MDLNNKINGTRTINSSISINKPINPQNCPQCRYYKLNQRIGSIKAEYMKNPGSINFISGLVAELKKDKIDENNIAAYRTEIEKIWKPVKDSKNDKIIQNDIINVPQARRAFEISRKTGIRPFLALVEKGSRIAPDYLQPEFSLKIIRTIEHLQTVVIRTQ